MAVGLPILIRAQLRPGRAARLEWAVLGLLGGLALAAVAATLSLSTLWLSLTVLAMLARTSSSRMSLAVIVILAVANIVCPLVTADGATFALMGFALVIAAIAIGLMLRSNDCTLIERQATATEAERRRIATVEPGEVGHCQPNGDKDHGSADVVAQRQRTQRYEYGQSSSQLCGCAVSDRAGWRSCGASSPGVGRHSKTSVCTRAATSCATGQARSRVHANDLFLVRRDDLAGDPQVEKQEGPFVDRTSLPLLDDVEIGQGSDDDAVSAGGRGQGREVDLVDEHG